VANGLPYFDQNPYPLPYDGKPGPCFDHPGVRMEAERFTREYRSACCPSSAARRLERMTGSVIVDLGVYGRPYVGTAETYWISPLRLRLTTPYDRKDGLYCGLEDQCNSLLMTNTIKQKMKMFIKPDLLITDEIGYRKMDQTAAHFFFKLSPNGTNVALYCSHLQQDVRCLGRHLR
jgi:hypothetical protein